MTTGDGKPIGATRPIFNDLSGELKVETDRLAKVLADDLRDWVQELPAIKTRAADSPGRKSSRGARHDDR